MVLLTISQLATACSSKQEEYEKTKKALQKLEEQMREQTQRRLEAEKKTNKIIQEKIFYNRSTNSAVFCALQ
jgi:hypothetical protein